MVEEPPMAGGDGAGTAAVGPFAAARERPLLVLLLVIFLCNYFLAGAFPRPAAHEAGRGAGAGTQLHMAEAASVAATAAAGSVAHAANDLASAINAPP